MRAFRRLALTGFGLWLLAVLLQAWIESSLDLRLRLGDARHITRALENREPGCRVLIVGSSPAVYGLSAASLQASTGCRSANLGLAQIGARLDAYLVTVLDRVRPGDVVVLTDRRWTEVGNRADGCNSPNALLCFFGALNAVPYLIEQLRRVFELNLVRDAQGDLVAYPQINSRLVYASASTMSDIEHSVARIAAVASTIRKRGACPLLAAVPVLTRPASKPALESNFAALAERVSARVGRKVWVGPLVETSPALFVLDGQHASANERMRWTRQVGQALQAACPQLPHSTVAPFPELSPTGD